MRSGLAGRFWLRVSFEGAVNVSVKTPVSEALTRAEGSSRMVGSQGFGWRPQLLTTWSSLFEYPHGMAVCDPRKRAMKKPLFILQ